MHADESEPTDNGEASEIDETNLSLEVLKGFSAKIIQAILGFAGTIIFARLLGPTSFGGFYLLHTVVQLSLRPMMGVANASMKRFSEFGTDRREIVGTQLTFNFIILGIAVPAAFVLNEPLSNYTGLDGSAALYTVLFVSVVFFGSFQQLLPARGLLGVEVWNDTIRSVLTTALQILFVLGGFGAAGMVYGLSAATYLTIPITHYYLRILPAVPTRETVQSVWRFARYSIVNRLVGHTYDRLDVLLLGALLKPAAAGYYEVALKFTVPATFVSGLAGTGLLNKVSSSSSKGESASMDITNTLAYASIISVPLFFGALAIARPLIVTAYGTEYVEASSLLAGLALFALLRSQSAPMESVVNGLDLPDQITRVAAFTLALNVAIGIPLILKFGPIGAVVGTVVAESIRYLAFARLVQRETGATLIPRPLREQILAGALMYGAVKLTHESILQVRSWADLLVLLFVGGVVYFAILTGVSRSFRFTLKHVYEDARG
ncbi:lipopolysaccharide biosynthesis protein [Halogeometricum borinquense]|uniref:Lipopolysaccharide biosynthesis protein n=1 Tax=Halogeometricum borinquense TaxID=60847 RepID=A0A482TBS5_9EURY|nr:lipopolysaccharide biosynthesis protein [Halogeometricum borinquense]RYJ13706.1 lipopolysaccharide biosynthesis protein [Halogeometricum borinquense]